MSTSTQRIGILGGTGPQGRGLARRFAMAGLPTTIGSRSAERAAEVAVRIGHGVRGDSNEAVAEQADIVVVAVPWEGHGELLKALSDRLAGKIVVDCVNPLGFDKQGPYALHTAHGSAAEEASAMLPSSRVTAAFHHVSAEILEDENQQTCDVDVLVLGDDPEATDAVQKLADAVPGMRGIYGGRLRNAHQVEAMTANLIAINRRYKTHAGLRITDVG